MTEADPAAAGSTRPTRPVHQTEDADASSTPASERVQFALRQVGLVTLALVVAGSVAERLRPDTIADRGFASTIYWWAIVVWIVVLLVNATAFERSQMKVLEGPPLIAAVAIGVLSLVTGLIRLEVGAFVYLLATALGTIMFWWGLLGLALLLIRRVSS